MMRTLRAFGTFAGGLLTIVLLVGSPAVARAGKPWDTPGVLASDAYWANNENQTPGSLLGSLTPVQYVAIDAVERSSVADAQQAWGMLSPDAYSYNSEDHRLHASTPPLERVTHAKAR